MQGVQVGSMEGKDTRNVIANTVYVSIGAYNRFLEDNQFVLCRLY